MRRSAVHQYVRNKHDAFRRLAGRLHEQALGRARQAAAADEDAPYGDRIRGVLAAKLDLVRRLTGTPRTPLNSSTRRPGCSTTSVRRSRVTCGAC